VILLVALAIFKKRKEKKTNESEVVGARQRHLRNKKLEKGCDISLDFLIYTPY